MDQYNFMGIVKDILDEVPNDELVARGQQMKLIIDKMVKMELNYANSGLRGDK